MSFYKLYFVFVFFAGVTAFGQTKPNATPYTVEGTYEKLKKKYPFIKPISKPIPENILIEENIIYENVNNQPLKADIYYPKNLNKKYPGIILIHGGGWISGSKENEKFMAQELASQGYVVMAVNYRLSNVAKYPAAILDIQNAIHFLKKNNRKYAFNKNKIGIYGESAGAQIATLIGVKAKGKIKAIVNVDGIVSFTHPESEESNYAAYWLDGDKNTHLKNWQDASPLEFVDKKTPPTLFINSSQPRFHAGRDDMMKKLRDYKTFTQFIEIKDSPHSFWVAEPWFSETLQHTLEFFNQFLKK